MTSNFFDLLNDAEIVALSNKTSDLQDQLNNKKDEPVKTSSITIQTFSHCDENSNPVYVTNTVSVIEGTEEAEALKFQQIVKHYRTSPLPDYKKGQYEVLLTLKDNSKLIINAFSVDEAEKMLEASKALIQPEYLEGAIQRPIAPRKGPQLLEIDVGAKRVDYFSTGLKNTKPDWVDVFT